MKELLSILHSQLLGGISLFEKRPGIYQVALPIQHEDGDPVDLFLEWQDSERKLVKISDYGFTLMRLSYTIEIDSANKRKIFDRILFENGVQEDDGSLFYIAPLDRVFPFVMQLAQVVAKVSSLDFLQRETVKSLFDEIQEEFITNNLQEYHPVKRYYPLGEDRTEYEVDWLFKVQPKPIFLFGVPTDLKAKNATIACQQFQMSGIPFRSLIVHEEFESINRKDRARLTNVVDKQFASLDAFKEQALNYFHREVTPA